VSKKKKPSASNKARQGHPARSAATGAIVSINEFRARSSGDDVSAGFMKWSRANTSLLELGDPLPVLNTFLENYRTAAKTEVTTALEPFETQVALGKYFFDHPQEDYSFVLHVAMGYLLYLDDSDLWSGSDQQFEDVQEALLESVDEQSDAEFDDRVFEVPALSRAQTREALLALPLTAHLQAFIAWFGEKRDVTSTGLLTRKDIEGAAAALGVDARGVSAISAEASLKADAPFQATSAQQVPQLDLFWEALVRIELIEVGSRRATMNRPLDSLAGAAHEEMLMHLVRDVALSLYMQFIAAGAAAELDAAEDPDDTDLFGDLLSSILLEAGIDDGVPTVNLVVAMATLADAGPDEVLLTQLALEIMVEEGLLERDTHFRIPPAMKRLVAFALAEPAGLEINYEDPNDQDLSYLGAED
jgi:hypothetical protein